MVDEGTARSIANVVQKLRKSCGVQATDALNVYYCVEKNGTENLPKLLSHWSAFISKKIGRSFHEIQKDEVTRHEYAGKQEVDSFGGGCVFTVYVTKPHGSAPGGQ